MGLKFSMLLTGWKKFKSGSWHLQGLIQHLQSCDFYKTWRSLRFWKGTFIIDFREAKFLWMTSGYHYPDILHCFSDILNFRSFATAAIDSYIYSRLKDSKVLSYKAMKRLG